MAVTLFRLFPKERWLGYVAITYALYIGIGVSVTIDNPLVLGFLGRSNHRNGHRGRGRENLLAQSNLPG